jgi:hypothetical protein
MLTLILAAWTFTAVRLETRAARWAARGMESCIVSGWAKKGKAK